MLLLLYLPVICGLAIVSKITFEDADRLKNEKKNVDTFLVSRTTNTSQPRTSRRKPATGKLVTSVRRVPIIKGAASSKELTIYEDDDLHPPRLGATDDWYQSLEASTRYPDSNGYYPNVGPYQPQTTPRPVYGAPPNTGTPSNWCPSGQGGGGSSWGNGPSWGQGNGGYNPNSSPTPPWGQQPNNQNGNSWGQGGYRPSQGGYPSSNNGGSWGQNGYGSGGTGGQNGQGSGSSWGQNGQNSGGTWGQNGQGSGSSWGQNGQSSGGTWGQNGQGSGSSWGQNGQGSGGSWGQSGVNPPSQGGGWSKSSSQRGGKWVPCQPFELSGSSNRRLGLLRGCPPETGREKEFVPPYATPTSKLHDKLSSAELPPDVEEITP